MKYLKTIIWFITHPKYMPQIFQVLRRKKNHIKENTRDKATQWVKNNAIKKEKALQLVCQTHELIHPKNKHTDYFQYAYTQANNCPVQMGGEGAIDFLYTIIVTKQPKNIIETGVAYGWSALAILLAIKNDSDAFLISNDMPYIKMNNDDFVGCVVHQDLRHKWELQRLPDIKGIPQAIKKFNGSIDLCHYDSDKSYTGRMFAYPLLWEALKKGGIFISDDIQDNIAFKEFAEKVNRTPIIFEHKGKYVGIITK